MHGAVTTGSIEVRGGAPRSFYFARTSCEYAKNISRKTGVRSRDRKRAARILLWPTADRRFRVTRASYLFWRDASDTEHRPSGTLADRRARRRIVVKTSPFLCKKYTCCMYVTLGRRASNRWSSDSEISPSRFCSFATTPPRSQHTLVACASQFFFLNRTR